MTRVTTVVGGGNTRQQLSIYLTIRMREREDEIAFNSTFLTESLVNLCVYQWPSVPSILFTRKHLSSCVAQ